MRSAQNTPRIWQRAADMPHLAAKGVLLVTRIRVRLTPRGRHNAIDGWDGDVLHVHVSAAPAEGKANDALVRLLAKELGIAASRVSIASGTASRLKMIDIDGMSADDARGGLGFGLKSR